MDEMMAKIGGPQLRGGIKLFSRCICVTRRFSFYRGVFVKKKTRKRKFNPNLVFILESRFPVKKFAFVGGDYEMKSIRAFRDYLSDYIRYWTKAGCK